MLLSYDELDINVYQWMPEIKQFLITLDRFIKLENHTQMVWIDQGLVNTTEPLIDTVALKPPYHPSLFYGQLAQLLLYKPYAHHRAFSARLVKVSTHPATMRRCFHGEAQTARDLWREMTIISYIVAEVVHQHRSTEHERKVNLSKMRMDLLYLHSSLPWSAPICHSKCSEYLHSLGNNVHDK